MLQSFKKISWILLLAFGLQTSWAFSLLGPISLGDAWQVETIGFNPITAIDGNSVVDFVDQNTDGPKNIGEEYRRNTPVIYYAEDANFLNYFGPQGSAAVDQAFVIINASLTNNSLASLDGYSPALTEFPLNSESVNYQAFAVGLLDLKSETMALAIEQLGLADSVRYTWILHNRYHDATSIPCPSHEFYEVTMRNFDLTANPPVLTPPYVNGTSYSPYVNGTLFTYLIEEICANPPAGPLADAAEQTADPLAINPPVSSLQELPTFTGAFFTGLTRDDMAGLRFLLSTNTILYESPTPGSVLVSSATTGGINYGPPFVLYTSNYTAFAEAALTNDPVALSNLYPGLIITSSTPFYSYTPVTTYVAYYTNLIGAPAGSQTLVVAPVTTYTVVTTYSNTYANLVVPPGSYTNGSSVGTVYTVTVGPLSGAPAGSPFATNTSTSFISQPNVPTGDFYINTNACGTNLILSTLASIPVYTTNVIYSATNALGESATKYIVTASTIHIYVAEAPICGNSSGGGTTTNAPGLYQGIGKVQFVKTSYDSLLGQFYQPITNNYPVNLIFNSKLVKQTFQRVVTTPDLLFSAADLLPAPAADNSIVPRYSRTEINFDQSNVGAGLDGPGVINPTSTIQFNKVGPVYYNEGTIALSLSSAQLIGFVWGSFDGTTNSPVVYPNGSSFTNLANQVLVQISPAALPVGTKGSVYPTTTFVATGGAFTPPFTWSLPFGGLPPGLVLSSGGTISGTPTQSGTFDFTVQLTDYVSRSVTWDYSITIN
jgi:large repetitive protein